MDLEHDAQRTAQLTTNKTKKTLFSRIKLVDLIGFAHHEKKLRGLGYNIYVKRNNKNLDGIYGENATDEAKMDIKHLTLYESQSSF